MQDDIFFGNCIVILQLPLLYYNFRTYVHRKIVNILCRQWSGSLLEWKNSSLNTSKLISFGGK